jgi:hypothetical protein
MGGVVARERHPNPNYRIALGALIYVKAPALAHKRIRLSSNAKSLLTGRSTKRVRYGVGIIAAQGPLCPMRYERSTPKPPLCPSCGETMRLARTTPRFGDLLDVYAFECRACGVSHIETA